MTARGGAVSTPRCRCPTTFNPGTRRLPCRSRRTACSRARWPCSFRRFRDRTRAARSNGDQMPLHALAGKIAPPDVLVDVDRLRNEYHQRTPDAADPSQRVRFGTSGHRGTSLHGSFNEAHILAITQAICDYRSSNGITGPLFMGRDTHALSAPAFATAL